MLTTFRHTFAADAIDHDHPDAHASIRTQGVSELRPAGPHVKITRDACARDQCDEKERDENGEQCPDDTHTRRSIVL